MKTHHKKLLHTAGTLIALIAIVFVAQRLWQNIHALDPGRITSATWLAIPLLCLVYSAANPIRARIWYHLLHAQQTPVHWAWALYAYGASDIAKYLPGNIFQFAGRQTLGMAAGIQATVLLKSAFWEITLMVGSGSLFLILIPPLLSHHMTISVPGIPILLILYITLVMILLGVLRRFFGPDANKAAALQVLFLGISGLTFAILMTVITRTPVDLSLLTSWTAAYIIAWLIGLITPGAPAGLGIREAILLLLLTHTAHEAHLLLAIAISRVITTIADIALFF